jgi:hypothetical protein
MTRSVLVLALALTACDGGTDSDSAVDSACDVTVTTFPATGAVDAYYRGNIEFKLTGTDSTATIETDIPGSQAVSEDGLTVYWIPSAPLAPNTQYSATLHYCGGDAAISFTTSSLGTPLPDDGVLQGKTYLLDLQHARVTEPPGIGPLIAGELGGVSIFVGVTDVTPPNISMIGALGREDAENTQEYCDPSIDFPVADFSGTPHFEIGGEGSTTITVADVTVEIQSLRIAGDFSSDASYFGGGVLEGSIDTRPLDSLLDDSGEPGAICNTATSLGVTCEECGGDNPGPYCLSLKVDSITATEAPLELVAIEGSDCAGCLEGVPADTSKTCEPDAAPQ